MHQFSVPCGISSSNQSAMTILARILGRPQRGLCRGLFHRILTDGASVGDASTMNERRDQLVSF